MRSTAFKRRAKPPPEAVSRAHLLQVYVADYNAMATRINTFMALQFVPWPPLVVVLGLVVNAFNTRTSSTSVSAFDPDTTSFVVWLTVMAVHAAVYVYLFSLYEVYNHSRYVETELRPKLSEIINIQPNWGYERFLIKTGKANKPQSGDSGVLVLPIVAILFAFYQRATSELSWMDLLFFLNIWALWNARQMVYRVFAARERMFRAIDA